MHSPAPPMHDPRNAVSFCLDFASVRDPQSAHNKRRRHEDAHRTRLEDDRRDIDDDAAAHGLRRRRDAADRGHAAGGPAADLCADRDDDRPGFVHRLADHGRHGHVGHHRRLRGQWRGGHRRILSRAGRHRAAGCDGAADQDAGQPANGLERQGDDVRRWRLRRLDPERRRQRPRRPDRPARPARPWLRHVLQRLRPPGRRAGQPGRLVRRQRRGRRQFLR